MRRCRICQAELPLEAFVRDKKNPVGRGYYCRPCNAARRRPEGYKPKRSRPAFERGDTVRVPVTEGYVQAGLAGRPGVVTREPQNRGRWYEVHREDGRLCLVDAGELLRADGR